MNSKWKGLFVLFCIVGLGLSACSSSRKSAESYPSYMMDVEYSEGSERLSAPEKDSGEAADTSRKIIQTAEIKLQVDETKNTYQIIVEQVKSMQGYVSYSLQVERTHGTVINVTVRIPSQQMDDFLGWIQSHGKILYQQIGTEEITKQYFDTKARLDNAIVQKKQYELILSKAEKIEDILAVQREIDIVQERIEIFRGEIERWDLLVDHATINIELTPNPRIIEDQKKSAWNPLGWNQMWGAFYLRAIQVANAMVIIFQLFVVSLPIIAIILLLLWLVYFLFFKKHKRGAKRG